MSKSKRKVTQLKANVKALARKALEQKARDRKVLEGCLAALEQSRRDLKVVERAIVECVGQNAAVLGVKTVEFHHDPGDVYHYSVLRHLDGFTVVDRILHKLEVREVRDAIDCLIFQVVDRSRGVKVEGKLALDYFVTAGWDKPSRVREHVALDIAKALIERLSSV